VLVLRWLNTHFECAFVAYLWVNAAILAVLVGRPALGAIGLVTVLPVIAAYVWKARR
jgi:hypothetical protein